MPLYETVFMARQDVSTAQVETMIETFTNILTEGQGKVTKTENWGLRALAYRVRKNRKAHYVLLNIDAPPAAITEMERNMKISEDVLRVQTLRVDEHQDGPSAILTNKGDREERGERGGRGDREGGRGRGDREGGRGERGDRPSRFREDRAEVRGDAE